MTSMRTHRTRRQRRNGKGGAKHRLVGGRTGTKHSRATPSSRRHDIRRVIPEAALPTNRLGISDDDRWAA